MNEEEIRTDHFKTMEELLKHLKMWETDDDYDAYYRFFCRRCAYEMAHKIDKLQKENKELKEENKELRDTNNKLYEMGQQRAIQELLSENWVNKEVIREFIKKELPDDEIMECCSNCDVNGVAIRKELEKILADKE